MSKLRCGWETPEGTKLTVLCGVDLRIAFGQRAVVMGPVGCGKSTLLLALLGELNPEEGSIGRAADTPMLYAPQQPWIFPGTVRDNILWGRAYDHEAYVATVEACQLVGDLLQLNAGDGAMASEVS